MKRKLALAISGLSMSLAFVACKNCLWWWFDEPEMPKALIK